ncbi:MAG: hypothetical protein ACREM2_03960, partial [Vulcanimicrobiaceae bacterium]
MRPRPGVRFPLRTLLGLVLVAALVLLFRNPLIEAMLVALAHAGGYSLSLGSLDAGFSGALAERARLTTLGGEPVLRAERIELRYSALGLLRGTHPFGVRELVLVRPHLTLIHRPDGSWNVPLPSGAAGAGATTGSALPALDLRVVDGSLVSLDATQLDPRSRRLALERLALALRLRGDRAPGSLRGSFELVEPGGRYPATVRGRFEPGSGGFALATLAAPRVALAPVVNAVLNTPAFRLEAGNAERLRVRVWAFRSRTGTLAPHLSAWAALSGVRAQVGGLSAPLRAGHGIAQAFDGTLVFPKVAATFEGVPVTIRGGLYGTPRPRLRLGIAGSGLLERLISLAPSAAATHPSGSLGFRLLVEGPPQAPLVLARLASPQASLSGILLRRLHALVALRGAEVTIFDAATDAPAAGAAVALRGSAHLEAHPRFTLAASIRASTEGLPALAAAQALLGPMTLRGTAVLLGTAAAPQGALVASGATVTRRLFALARIERNGTAVVDPFALDESDGGSLLALARYDLHRRCGVAFLAAERLALGLAGPQPLHATLDARGVVRVEH